MPESRTSKVTCAKSSGAGSRDHPQHDLAALRELDRIADQIEDDLLQPLAVGNDPVDHVGSELETQGKALRIRIGLEQGHCGICQGAQRDRREREAHLPCLDLRVVEDVVEDAHQRCARRGGGSNQRALLGIERRVAQQVQCTEDAVHRRTDLMTHRREELRLRAVGGLGRLLGDLQRSRRKIGLKAVPDRADGGVAELPRGAEHRHAEQGDQHGERQRHQTLRPERHRDDAAQLGHGEKEEGAADQCHEQRGHRDRSAGEEDIGLLHPTVQVGEDAEAADQPHGPGEQGVPLQMVLGALQFLFGENAVGAARTCARYDPPEGDAEPQGRGRQRPDILADSRAHQDHHDDGDDLQRNAPDRVVQREPHQLTVHFDFGGRFLGH